MAPKKKPILGKGQDCLVEDTFKRGYGNKKYDPSYCQLAYEVMSKKAFQSKAHLCVALHCSKDSLLDWMQKYPDFKEAVESGLIAGAQKTRDKIAQHAFKPSATVNNGLIKLLAANVYGIKEEPTTIINNNIKTGTVTDADLKEKGIPVPDLPIEDIGD